MVISFDRCRFLGVGVLGIHGFEQFLIMLCEFGITVEEVLTEPEALFFTDNKVICHQLQGTRAHPTIDHEMLEQPQELIVLRRHRRLHPWRGIKRSYSSDHAWSHSWLDYICKVVY